MTSFFRIEIPRRSATCFKGGETFKAGDPYYSLVKEEEKEKLLREDYCLACWEKASINKEALTVWKGKVPKKHEKKQPVDRNLKALELLKEALAKDTPDSHQEAFVLALYLVRFRQIVLRKELKNSLSLYEVIETEEMLTVPKLKLTSAQTKDLQERIAKKLNQDATEIST